MFAEDAGENIEKILATTQSALQPEDVADSSKPYTLENYSIDHFRVPKARTLTGSLRGGLRRKESHNLWSFSRVSVCSTFVREWVSLCIQQYKYGFHCYYVHVSLPYKEYSQLP